MTPDQEKAIAIAQLYWERHGRRPNGREIAHLGGGGVGPKKAFQTLHELLEAAGLALPAKDGRPGLRPEEEATFLRLYEAREPTTGIQKALGISGNEYRAEVIARGLSRPDGKRKKNDTLAIRPRRCHNPVCEQLTPGLGPCQHCGTPSLVSAA